MNSVLCDFRCLAGLVRHTFLPTINWYQSPSLWRNMMIVWNSIPCNFLSRFVVLTSGIINWIILHYLEGGGIEVAPARQWHVWFGNMGPQKNRSVLFSTFGSLFRLLVWIVANAFPTFAWVLCLSSICTKICLSRNLASLTPCITLVINQCSILFYFQNFNASEK